MRVPTDEAKITLRITFFSDGDCMLGRWFKKQLNWVSR